MDGFALVKDKNAYDGGIITHTTVALYGENAAVVIGQGSGGAFQGI